MKIVAISGSNKTKAASLNNAVLEAVKELMPSEVDLQVADIKDFPIYSEDYDKNFPEKPNQFKELIRSADAIIIVTPEYNRSVPPVLSNAMAWSSRPYPDNAWAGKPVITMGATTGGISTYSAQAHLKQILAHVEAVVLPVNVYIGNVGNKMQNDKLTDETTRKFIKQAIARLIDVTNKLQG